MASAVKQDLSVERHTTLQWTELVTADGTDVGAPVNVTGWSVECVVHALPGDETPLKTYTVGSGITIPVGTDGKLVITVPEADVEALLTAAPGRLDFVYYIRRTDAGAEAVLTDGEFHVNQV